MPLLKRFSSCKAADEVVSPEVIESKYRILEVLTGLPRAAHEATLWEEMGLDENGNPGLVNGVLSAMIRAAEPNREIVEHVRLTGARPPKPAEPPKGKDDDDDDGLAGVLALVPA